RQQEGPGRPFRKVRVVTDGPLLHPTRVQLLDALADLHRRAPAGSVAWVAISGHGIVAPDGQFFLTLAGRDGPDEQVSWEDVYPRIDQVHCPVVVVLDTCSSGEVHSSLATAIGHVRQPHWGRVLITASFGRAHEADDWGHSAL